MNLNRDEIKLTLIEILNSNFSVENDQEYHFGSLDSLGFVKFLVEVEKKFSIKFRAIEVFEIKNKDLNDLAVKILNSIQNGKI